MDDRAIAERQLGRAPRAFRRVAVRCPYERPAVTEQEPFDETGTQLATGCHDGNLRVWDVAKAQAVKTIAAHVQTTPQNISNAQEGVSVSGRRSGRLLLYAALDSAIFFAERAANQYEAFLAYGLKKLRKAMEKQAAPENSPGS